jgi:integrase
MGSIFKQRVTRDIPAGAEMIEKHGKLFARWKGRRLGKFKEAEVITRKNGTRGIVEESATYFGKYRNGDCEEVVVSLKCREAATARNLLAGLERQAELERMGIVRKDETARAEQGRLPIGQHIDSYTHFLIGKGAGDVHRANTASYLRRLTVDCGFSTLADLDRGAFERWLSDQVNAGRSARSRNAFREALIAFCNWCVKDGRLASNPFAGVEKANTKADPRRQRRSLTQDEIGRLLAVARERPLIEAQTVRKGPRKGERYADLRPATVARLRKLGDERSLIYEVLVTTGLRRNELASLTVAQLIDLDGPRSWIELDAADEKNRQGNAVPLRADVAKKLSAWVADKRPRDPVFTVPAALVKILNRDMRLAGIPKRDDRGRTIDVHALRHTFGTLLARGGVPLRTAQQLMRHSDPKLTANVYTDARLLDVHGALDVLPTLSDLNKDRQSVTLSVTLTDGEQSQSVSFPDTNQRTA